MTASIEFRNVDIIFGDKTDEALKLAHSGVDRSEILKRTGAVLGAPATARLSGTANGPKLVTSTPRLAFEEQAVGSSSAAKTIKVTNQGNAALNFSRTKRFDGFTLDELSHLA